MKSRNFVAVALSAFTVVAIALAARPGGAAPAQNADAAASGVAFKVDPVHSTLIFKINHMGVANFYGRFNDIQGTYVLNEANPANCTFEFQVKTENVDTGNKSRDGHLKSADFFNASEYPLITFKSTKVERKSEMVLNVTGDLTMHGVTKPVTADIKIFGAKDTRQGVKGGLDATFTIKRSDFEMSTYVAEGGLGDEVTLMVAIEGARQ